jgi:hypothetical protein
MDLETLPWVLDQVESPSRLDEPTATAAAAMIEQAGDPSAPGTGSA